MWVILDPCHMLKLARSSCYLMTKMVEKSSGSFSQSPYPSTTQMFEAQQPAYYTAPGI